MSAFQTRQPALTGSALFAPQGLVPVDECFLTRTEPNVTIHATAGLVSVGRCLSASKQRPIETGSAVAVMLFFRVLVNKHASTGASPAVSVRHLNWRSGSASPLSRLRERVRGPSEVALVLLAPCGIFGTYRFCALAEPSLCRSFMKSVNSRHKQSTQRCPRESF